MLVTYQQTGTRGNCFIFTALPRRDVSAVNYTGKLCISHVSYTSSQSDFHQFTQHEVKKRNYEAPSLSNILYSHVTLPF
jgi:hypothetical protein